MCLLGINGEVLLTAGLLPLPSRVVEVTGRWLLVRVVTRVNSGELRVSSGSNDDAGQAQVQPGADKAYSVDARGSRAVQVGQGNFQANYTYNWLTFTDGVTPAPLVSVSGKIDSPYRGLSAFDEQDAAFFFGREEAAEELLGRMSRLLGGPGLMVVSGVSGAGKSSLLRAGILPQIRGAGVGSVPGSQAWPCLVLTPGHAPLDELAFRVAMLARTDAAGARRGLDADPKRFALTVRQAAYSSPEPGARRPARQRAAKGRRQREQGQEPKQERRLLLVVDQFEQLFTQCHDEGQRKAFITALCAAAGVDDQPGRAAPAAIVVLGVRADFEARCADYSELAAAVQDRYLVTAMTERQLRMAITEPAKMVGSRVEDDLVEMLLADARARQPSGGTGALPLLSHALDQAWRSRAGEILAVTDYARTGGIEGAVASSAQRAYDGLSPSQQVVAREVFMRLTATTSEGYDTVDRATRAELTEGKNAAGFADVVAVLEAFATERLLTLAADSVEISHEVLLTAWPLLRDSWLAQNHADRIVRTRLRTAAAEWARYSSDPAYLYSGTLLQAATSAIARAYAGPSGNPVLSQTERDFLRASDHARRRASRRARSLVAGLAVLTLAAGSAAVIAWRNAANSAHNAANAAAQAANADKQRAIGLSRELAAESASAAALDQPVIARQLAVAAWAVSPTSQAAAAMASLVAAAQQGSLLPAAPTSSRGGVEVLAFSSDGHLIATGDGDGTLRLWDPATRQPVRTIHVPASGSGDGPNGVGAAAFSPNGKLLATGDDDGTVQVWDPGSGRLMASVQPPSGEISYPSNATSAAFSPDGRLLAVSYSSGQVWLWNTPTWQPARVINANYKPGQGGGGLGVNTVSFSPDGAMLATADANGVTRLWDTATGKPTGTLNEAIFAVDGVGGVAFSPDGQLLATAEGNGSVQLWNLRTRRPIATVGRGDATYDNEVYRVAFSPDGRLVAAANIGGEVRMWDAGSGRLVLDHTPGGNTASPGVVAFSPDGGVLAESDGDGAVQLWSTATMLPAGQSLQGNPANGLYDLEFNPRGDVAAGAGADGTVKLWNLASGQLIRTLHATTADEGVSLVEFSPDGHALASVDPLYRTGGFIADGIARLWNPRTGRLIRVLQRDVLAATFSPDGKLMATVAGRGDSSIRLWDSATGRLVATLRPPNPNSGGVDGVAFTSNGQLLASDDDAGDIQLWDVATGRLMRAWQAGGPSSGVTGLAFSPDGGILASGGADAGHGAQLWNPATGRLVKTLRAASAGGVDDVEFSPDGTRIVGTDADGRIQLWNALTGQAIGTPLGTKSPADPQSTLAAVAFSPDGKVLAGSLAANGSIQLWNAATGTALGSPFGPTSNTGAVSLTFSPDGRLLAEVPANGPAQLWTTAAFENPYAALCADVGSPTPATWAALTTGEKEPPICPAAERGNALSQHRQPRQRQAIGRGWYRVAERRPLWLGTGGREPLDRSGIQRLQRRGMPQPHASWTICRNPAALDLSWLADAPVFIDSRQIGAFYDAVVGPAFRTVQLQVIASQVGSSASASCRGEA
jgi:WD40 repeat protein